MKKFDIVKVKEKNIFGINYPLVHIHLCFKEKCNYKLEIDGKSCEYDVIYLDDPNEIIITCSIDKNNSLIKLFAIHKDSEYLICTLKNNLFVRMCSKLKKLKSDIKVKYKMRRRKIEPYYNPFVKEEYQKWIDKFDFNDSPVKLKYNPLISIIVPVYNVDRVFLCKCLDSILNQTYQNFEICLADDCSTNKETLETLKQYSEKDSRIKVFYRKKNGHISATSNSALEMATGEYIALMDNDDIISKNALYEMVKVLNLDKKIDMIYTDEDKIDFDGTRCEPHFKSDYAPDTLLSSNYICHFTLLRKNIVDEIGGFREGYEGAQDYDLFLRFTEKTNKIFHIPKILYHWRKLSGSTAVTVGNKGYAIQNGKKALEDALKRRDIKGEVIIHEKIPYYSIRYIYDKEPMISIIIPTKDHTDILKCCIDSIYNKTNYKNYEVIVVNNNSEKTETFELFEMYDKKYSNFKVIDANMEFNYSKINNLAVNESKGEYIVLLNNDTEVISPDWLELMVGYAMQKHIGTVGVKLLYPNDKIQHAGVVMGLGGIASHAFLNLNNDECGFYGRLAVPYNYSANTAACLMVSRNKFLEVGGLEEKLKVAYNDVDFNLKLLNKGYYNVFIPQVQLYHYESKSRGLDDTLEKQKRFSQESKFMYDNWSHMIFNDPYYNSNLSKYYIFMLDKNNTN